MEIINKMKMNNTGVWRTDIGRRIVACLCSAARAVNKKESGQPQQQTSYAGGRHNIPRPPGPCKLTFDLLTLKVVSESRVTWATSVPILVFQGLSVLDLGPMYATDKTSDAHHRLMPPTLRAGHNKQTGASTS